MKSSPESQPLHSTNNDLTLHLLRPAKFCSRPHEMVLIKATKTSSLSPGYFCFQPLKLQNLPPPKQASPIHFRSSDTRLAAKLCSLDRRAFLSPPSKDHYQKSYCPPKYHPRTYSGSEMWLKPPQPARILISHLFLLQTLHPAHLVQNQEQEPKEWIT